VSLEKKPYGLVNVRWFLSNNYNMTHNQLTMVWWS